MKSSPGSKKTKEKAVQAAKRAFGAAAQNPLGTPPAADSGEGSGRQRLAGAFLIRTERIKPDPDQPRRVFDDKAQEELAASIKRLGVLQPIAVRYVQAEDTYLVISGERRYQACRALKLAEIPCWVQSPEDSEILLRQIAENWQRADLNPYELSDSLVRLMEENGYSQEELARVTGKPKSEISKLLSILKLAPEVQSLAREDEAAVLSKRHLYAISQLKKPEEQAEAVRAVKERKLTAMATEKLVSAKKPSDTGRKKPAAAMSDVRYETKQAVVTLRFRKRHVSPADILTALDEARRSVAARNKLAKPDTKPTKDAKKGSRKPKTRKVSR